MPQCPLCGKKGIVAWRIKKLRGKYNPTTKIRKKPNLQWVTLPSLPKKREWRRFAGQRIKACAKCIKTLEKT